MCHGIASPFRPTRKLRFWASPPRALVLGKEDYLGWSKNSLWVPPKSTTLRPSWREWTAVSSNETNRSRLWLSRWNSCGWRIKRTASRLPAPWRSTCPKWAKELMTKQEGAALAPPLQPVLNEQCTHTYIVENACSQKRKISYVIQYVHVSRSRIRIMIERNKCTSQHFSKNTHPM